MPLFGPRLDRPSAIGDEGRPRATSLTVASVVVVATVAVTGHFAGFLGLTTSVATLTGLFTVGLALLNRERFLALFVGQLCYVLGGTGIVALLGVILYLSPAYGLLVAGFVLAFVGLTAAWADVGDAASTKTALFQAGVSYVSMFLWVAVVAVVGGVALVTWSVLTGSATTASPTASLLGFLFAVSVSSLFVWLGTRWLPVRQFTPLDRRDRLERRFGRFRIAAGLTSVVAFVAVVAGAVAWFLGAFDALYGSLPPASALFGGLSSPLVLGPVLLVGVVVLVAAFAALVLRRITRPTERRANQLLSAVVAGLAFTVLVVPFLYAIVPVSGGMAVAYVLLLLVVGPVALFAVAVTLLVAAEIDVLPDRAGGPALAAAGMVLATIGAGMAGVPSPVVFACAAAGMVAWDVSTFGLGVTAELGHLPETRRFELFHGILSVAVGVVAVAVLTGLDLLRTTAGAGLVAIPAVLLAVVALLLFLIPVRG